MQGPGLSNAVGDGSRVATDVLKEISTGQNPKKSTAMDGLAKEIAADHLAPRHKRRLRVLSLDGGGIRGYSTLVILSDLMHRLHVIINKTAPVEPHKLLRPCDFFDIIGGNGTGGLIALMLGRMRMDIETCKEYYESLARHVFFTDKTILGLPYGNTLFKASKLEEAIKLCVRECTRYDHLPLLHYVPIGQGDSLGPELPQIQPTSTAARGRAVDNTLGNPDASLFDHRVGACKTLVTTSYMSSHCGAPPVLLRSYQTTRDSTMVSTKATIWQAGRATCAIKAAFKPITIANVQFLDEGYGKYNPAQFLLDEALARETWQDTEDVAPDDDPIGPEIGVFVSIGTGKRFSTADARKDKPLWWENIGMLEQYSEAKKRLWRKLEDCETVHQSLLNGELEKRGVDKTNYYRFNVEVGVGEFELNEWNRLAEVSTGTRRYLARNNVEEKIKACAEKLANIWKENDSRNKLKTDINPDKETVPAEEAQAPNTEETEKLANIGRENNSRSRWRMGIHPDKETVPAQEAQAPNTEETEKLANIGRENNSRSRWRMGIHPEKEIVPAQEAQAPNTEETEKLANIGRENNSRSRWRMGIHPEKEIVPAQEAQAPNTEETEKLANIGRENNSRSRWRMGIHPEKETVPAQEAQAPNTEETEKKRERARLERRAAYKGSTGDRGAQRQRSPPSLPPMIAELRADIDQAASEWSSNRGLHQSSTYRASGSDAYVDLHPDIYRTMPQPAYLGYI
ncbi:acyl transferase/acyl hydrolase/lysophospholipase [Kalaharituber pfeilii]|nr:acyl transferase/acyl hydrolase/lysophospholipase [Kalaharituber pfeilii]